MKPAGIGLIEQLALGLFLGLILGIGGAFLAERLGGVLAGRADVEQLGLPVVGVVTHLDRNGNGKGSRGPDALVDSFRGIRLGVLNAFGTSDPIVLTVTSPAGRSTCSGTSRRSATCRDGSSAGLKRPPRGRVSGERKRCLHRGGAGRDPLNP